MPSVNWPRPSREEWWEIDGVAHLLYLGEFPFHFVHHRSHQETEPRVHVDRLERSYKTTDLGKHNHTVLVACRHASPPVPGQPGWFEFVEQWSMEGDHGWSEYSYSYSHWESTRQRRSRRVDGWSVKLAYRPEKSLYWIHGCSSCRRYSRRKASANCSL